MDRFGEFLIADAGIAAECAQDAAIDIVQMLIFHGGYPVNLACCLVFFRNIIGIREIILYIVGFCCKNRSTFCAAGRSIFTVLTRHRLRRSGRAFVGGSAGFEAADAGLLRVVGIRRAGGFRGDPSGPFCPVAHLGHASRAFC